MPMTSTLHWALAPEFAEGVAGLYRRSLEITAQGQAAPVHAETPSPADIARCISRRAGSVAVISIEGPIDRTSRVGWWSGNIFAVGQNAIRLAVEGALQDGAVRAVLLSVDSPGGVVAGTKELADYLAEASAVKPMGAYVNGLAASAAYWLAASTGRILAPATGQVGSIGVIMMVADYSGYYQRLGVSFEYIAGGRFKAAGRGDRPLSDEERAHFQERLAALHALFRADVAARMGITAEPAHWAEGQVLSAVQAEPLGLVSAVVHDEEAAIQTMMEVSMPDYTREAPAGEASELMEALKAEARQEVEAEVAAAVQEKLSAAGAAGASLALAAMRAVCKEQDVQAVEAVMAKATTLGLSPAQLSGMAELFAGVSAQPKAAVPDSRQAVLEALQKSHEAPVRAEAPDRNIKSSLVADAERRAARAQL